MLNTLVQLFEAEDNFILSCHVQPDGDTIGSTLALGKFLTDKGKRVSLTCGEEIAIPPQYRFLPGIELIKKTSLDSRDAVFVALDCATAGRLGDIKDKAAAARVLVNIDHHPDNTNFGGINFVDPSASSVAEMIYQILRAGNAVIDPDMALCLYVGMVTDTGRFQYSNTTSATLRTAAELLECGVNPNYVFQNLFEKNTFTWLKIVGRGLEKAVYLPELKLVYSVVTIRDFLDTGASLGETENLVDWLRSLEGVIVAAVIKETRDHNLKVSLRSKGEFDVGSIANIFNGGGHRNAAGYVSEPDIPAAIKALVKAVEGQRRVESETV